MPGWINVDRLRLPGVDVVADCAAGLPLASASCDAAYFQVPDADARAIGGRLVAQIVWYGSVRTPFTYDCVAELLARAGFAAVRRCAFGVTHAPLAAHDNGPRETLFVEGCRP